jgi:formylglycine-generating enzyme required for sulfatase activity
MSIDSSSGSYPVYRGGSWYYGPLSARVADRFYGTPGRRGDFLGFRLMRRMS